MAWAPPTASPAWPGLPRPPPPPGAAAALPAWPPGRGCGSHVAGLPAGRRPPPPALAPPPRPRPQPPPSPASPPRGARRPPLPVRPGDSPGPRTPGGRLERKGRRAAAPPGRGQRAASSTPPSASGPPFPAGSGASPRPLVPPPTPPPVGSASRSSGPEFGRCGRGCHGIYHLQLHTAQRGRLTNPILPMSKLRLREVKWQLGLGPGLTSKPTAFPDTRPPNSEPPLRALAKLPAPFALPFLLSTPPPSNPSWLQCRTSPLGKPFQKLRWLQQGTQCQRTPLALDVSAVPSAGAGLPRGLGCQKGSKGDSESRNALLQDNKTGKQRRQASTGADSITRPAGPPAQPRLPPSTSTAPRLSGWPSGSLFLQPPQL
ncbi:basic proline-rich protein-like [Zalophus californianus]|uniref:Basic proline-rich protein-like n=1 Tax=Zalophus californianus TaxID=9704 RepID=A0A6P9FMR0_ZALCA|nr:basic proline-rich protein-like [Zalophus californianus]